MAPSEEDRPITRDVKAAIRGVLMYRTTSIDLLSLSHLYPARRQRTYTDLTTEIVATEQGLKKTNFNSEYWKEKKIQCRLISLFARSSRIIHYLFLKNNAFH